MRTYTIYSRYNGDVEEIDTAENLEEAEFMVAEYQMAYGPDCVIWYH